MTEACKEEMFTDSDHVDFSHTLAVSGEYWLLIGWHIRILWLVDTNHYWSLIGWHITLLISDSLTSNNTDLWLVDRFWIRSTDHAVFGQISPQTSLHPEDTLLSLQDDQLWLQLRTQDWDESSQDWYYLRELGKIFDSNYYWGNIFQKVVSCAREYPTVFQIQMAATACLFNLSKPELGSKIHPKILKEIVKIDLDAMETFPQHQQLQKNVLLTICSDRILQDVSIKAFSTLLSLQLLCCRSTLINTGVQS